MTLFLLRKGSRRMPFLLGILILLLAAAAGAQEQGQLSGKAGDALYRLRPGDEVAISVMPRKEYDCGGVILPDGVLYLRNVGAVKAVGLTLPELAEHVYRVLNLKLVEPKVMASLVRLAPAEPPKGESAGKITIVGAVQRIGPMALEKDLRVRKALDLAGGTTPEADLTRIVILHQDLTRTVVDLSSGERVSDPAHNRLLQDGDSLEVPALPAERKTVPLVRITGQVVNPGQYELKAGMALEDLIVTAGKLTSLADVERVQFQRAGKPLRTLNLLAQQELGLVGAISLEAGDAFFVPRQKEVVIVVGAVAEPGPKKISEGQTVREFFLQGDKEVASLLNPSSVNLKTVQLVRRGEEPRQINLEQLVKKADHKDNLVLQSGDVLFLPPKKQEQRSPSSALQYLQYLTPLGFLFAR